MAPSTGMPPAASPSRARRVSVLLATLLLACDVPTDLPRFESVFVVPGERIAVPVLSQPVSVTVTHDLGDAGDLDSRARAGAIVLHVDNPARAGGTIDLRISANQVNVQASIDPLGGDGQRIPLTAAEVQGLLGSTVTLRATATLCPAAGCSPGLPPGEAVTLRSHYELTLIVGTEG